MNLRKPLRMKRFLPLFLILGFFTAQAQKFNNEWIRFNQTYYKFKVGKAGLYRIPQSALQQAGIGTAGVEYLELWKNGEQVPFYPSVSSGTLPSDGYLEFWGEPNDGKPDRDMYRNPAFQHSTKYSLLTDTAVYFLSVNTNKTGFQYMDQANDVASNTLAPEKYFMHTVGTNYKSKINPGYAVVVGEYLYSSSYDKGEFWSSADIRPETPLKPAVHSNLFVETSVPNAIFRMGAAGSALNTRNFRASLNATTLVDTVMDYFNDVNTTIEIPTSLISTNSAAFQFTNTSTVSSDRMVVSYYELTYPRKFNFGGTRNFQFKLPAKNDGYYLEITNFVFGTSTPVLYDLTFGNRIVANKEVAGKLRFAIPGFDREHEFVLVSQEAVNINTISELSEKHFTQFTIESNQGDYLIISNSRLFNGANGQNPVEDYRVYRSSGEGGGFNAKIIDIDELVDQFAYGIKKHPLSIKNFLRYARQKFNVAPKFVFLVGRGMTYSEYTLNQSKPDIEMLNLVPTFGSPASDNMLSSADGASAVALTPIGRLSVVSPQEIEDYLEKAKEYEAVQRNAPQTVEARSWMKNIVHVTGSTDPYLGTVLCNYMGDYRDLIADTLFGGNVHTFCKTSTNPVEQVNNDKIAQLFEEGISILTYFGHSSSTTLEFNLDNPNTYNNQGKYPVFYVNGCNAGNFYTYNPQRLVVNETLSEKFVLAKQRGSIAFMASSHFGIVNYLNVYLDNLYKSIGHSDYGNTIGKTNSDALGQMIQATSPNDFYARMHAEQITVHGDPAIRINTQPKPDYVVEASQIKLNPSFISVADKSFQLKVDLYNLGKAVSDSLMVTVRRQFPNGTSEFLFNQKIAGIRAVDSLVFNVPIMVTRDKGSNKIIVELDAENAINEMAENNNSATAEFFVYEDEARPVYPYQFAIVNDPSQKLFASTANPFTPEKTYMVEIDSTQLFNSPLKVSKTITSKGGVFEMEPGIAYMDSTVYYWRVAPVPEQGNQPVWNQSSFVYISKSTMGWNQSHFFQYLKNSFESMKINAAREFEFDPLFNTATFKGSLYPYGSNTSNFNGSLLFQGGCGTYLNSFEFLLFDLRSGKNINNVVYGTTGKYGSLSPVCPDNGIVKQMLFDFYYNRADFRKRTMDFLDSIPNGTMVTMLNWGSMTFNSKPEFVDKWKADTALYGSNNSIYHKFLSIGLTKIDSFYRNIPFIFVFTKGYDGAWTVQKQAVGVSPLDLVSEKVDFHSVSPEGKIVSEIVGPAKAWKSMHWDGSFKDDSPSDSVMISVYGINDSFNEVLLFQSSQAKLDTTLDFIPAAEYPSLKFEMYASDHDHYSPFQLKYWQVKYDEVPEGVLEPKMVFNMKDTVELGEPNQLRIAFRNVSKAAFDSIQYKLVITDRNNNKQTIVPSKIEPLAGNDSLVVSYDIETSSLPESNMVFLDVNPDAQPEQYRFNNFMFRNFYVRPDKVNPVMDVTFDGVHILNQDIVSAKPHIRISLKDESKFMLLNDTAVSSLQVKYPNGTIRTYKVDSDTLRFTPAVAGTDNTATLDFYPSFTNENPEGDDYELIVKGKDRSGNKAGETEYRVGFRVISKPMISNMLNFPNPFSTSTAFVFTITGSEIPQNIKIQILTVTGKIVKEITREELGPLNIGRNITEYKWDGTDQYGQKLANGVYLYRVVSRLNGQRMEKYSAKGDETDRFFNNGYGKMYLMR